MSIPRHFFFAKFKDEIFIYFNILTENLIFSQLLGKFVLIINSIQKLGLLFQISYHQINSFNVFGQIVHQTLNLVIPVHLSNETGIRFIFQFFYWLFVAYLIFQIFYIIAILTTLKKYELVKYDSFNIPGLWYYKYLNLLYVYIFFLPQFSLICFGVKCYLNPNEKTVHNLTFDEVYGGKCDFFSLWVFFINLFQLLIMLALQFIHSLLLFNTETQSKNSLAYSYSPFHTFYLLYEIGMAILAFSGSYFMIFNIVVFMLQCFLVFVILNNHVFHDPHIEKTVIILLSGEMILAVFFEVSAFIESYSSVKSIYCFNIIFLLIYLKTIKIVSEYYDNYIETLLTHDVSDVSQETLIDKKIKVYFFYILKQEIHQQSINYKFDDYPSFLIRGFQEFHREHCKFPECLCKNKKNFIYDYSIRGEYIIDKEKPSNNLNNLIYIKHLLMNIYYVYSNSNKRKKSIFLRVNMAAFLFYQLKNFHKAVVECIDIKLNAHPHILHEILLARLMRDIDKFQFNLDRNKWDIPEYSGLDFAGLMRIEDNYLSLKSEIKGFITDYISFLGELLQDHPNINSLEETSKFLYCKRLRIDNIFHRNVRNPVSIRLYMEYLSNLIFSDDLKKPFEKEYLEKLELILTNQSNGKVFFELELMYNEDSIIVQMGSTKSNLGHIIKANEGMAKFCGYSIPELEYANINVLMPERIAEKHDNYLLTFMETSKGNVIYRERKIFARNKSGFIQFSSILMKPVYDYSHDIYKFVAYLQPFSSGIEFAVTDEYGFIDSISKGLGTICNMLPEAFESKRLMIQSIVPNLADIFIEKQLTPELKQQPRIKQLMERLKGCKLDNGDYICKVYPFLDGVEDFRPLIDKIGNKIQKKEYSGLHELIEELICYKEAIEAAIPNNCTFIMQATMLILYSQDKSLEMNIFCFKEVDSVYLEIPQNLYGPNSNIFKNLEYFLLMKQAMGKKKTNRSLSKDELDRMGTVSFYNSNTVKSLFSSQNEFENLPNDIYNESDDISIHMNKKLDEIFTKVKSKKYVDKKLQMLRNTSMKKMGKQVSKVSSLSNSRMKTFSSNRTMTIDEDRDGVVFDFIGVKGGNSPEKSQDKENKNGFAGELIEFEKNEEEDNEDKNKDADDLEDGADEINIDKNELEILQEDEQENDNEENFDEDDDKASLHDLEKNENNDEEGVEEMDIMKAKAEGDNSKNEISIPSPTIGKTQISSINSMKNNPSKTMKSATNIKSKQFVSLFKRNMMNTFHSNKTLNKTFISRKNPNITLNDKNQLKVDEAPKDEESDHEINRLKEKQYEAIKKQNNMLFHDGKGSSVGSSNATNVQARKSLRESINFDYIPSAFKKIIWLFTLSAILIFISQAISTIYFQYSMQSLEVSKNADQNYNEMAFSMIRISNSFYKLLLMQEGLLYTESSPEQKLEIFNDLMVLVDQDSKGLIEKVKYLESNYNYLNVIDYEIYNNHLTLNLINNTIQLKFLKSIYLFLTNSLELTKKSLVSVRTNSSDVYYLLRNINKFLSFFEANENFDSENSKIVDSIKQLMLTIFGLTCGVLFIMFILRMILYKSCYNYINDLFVMLGSVPNEDLRTLQYYLKSMKVIFDNTFVNITAGNAKKDHDDDEDNIDQINQNQIWQQKGNDSDLKNQRSVLQRRTKFFNNIDFPLSKITLINLIWYLVFFLGYIGLLGFANIFDNQLDIMLQKRVFIRSEQYIYPAKAFLYSMDYLSLKTRIINNSFLDITTHDYFDYMESQLPTKLVDFSLTSSYDAELYAVMQNTSVCLSVSLNQQKNIRFFSEQYCDNLLNGKLNIGVMPFLKDFYTCLTQINFETTNFSKKDITSYLNQLKFTDFSEGLEYIIWPLFNYNNQYRKSEDSQLNSKLTQINTFIILELVSISALVLVYWVFFLRPLKKRLIYCRKCFFHIPFAVINQQVKILKYINTTGNLLMKKK